MKDTRHLDWSVTKKARLFAILSDKRAHSSQELKKVSHRFGALILSLRQEGVEIRAYEVGGIWMYRWTGVTDKPFTPVHHSCPTCTCRTLENTNGKN